MQKPNFYFLRFTHGSTSKRKTKQTPFGSPFNFILTLLEWIYLKVKATILLLKKLGFGFWAEGFTRQFGQKNEKFSNFLHIISDVFAIILT